MSHRAERIPRALLAARHWPAWLQIGWLRLLALLPYRAGLAVGSAFGLIVFHLARKRRRVTAVNAALCFPELTANERRQLVRDAFVAAGIGIVEIAWSWWGPPRGMRLRVLGAPLFEAAHARGHGVLLLGGHFSTMDLGGRHLFQHIGRFDAIQRDNGDAAMQWAIARGRAHFCRPLERSDFRALIRSLRNGDTVWYAPDQDFGARNSAFVPFFGHTAATLTMSTRLAAVSGATTLFIRHHRERDGYVLEFIALGEFPGASAEADAAHYNRTLENAIRHHREQYLWMHKRFKTQPDGNQKLYRAAHC